MSTNPITPIARGFITRVKPINGITPFTYRDGLTYLQVLEALRAYIRDVLVDEFNRVIADLNEQGEQMAVEFQDLIDLTNDNIQTLIDHYQNQFDGVVDDYALLEQEVQSQINAVNSLRQSLETYYDDVDALIDSKIGEVDNSLDDIEQQLGVVDQRLDTVQAFADTLTYSVQFPQATALDSSQYYNAFPVSAHKDGVTVVAYAKYADHFGEGPGLTVLRTDNNGESWVGGSVQRPDPVATQWSPGGITATPDGFAMLVHHSGPYRMFITTSVDGIVWTEPEQFGEGYGTNIVWINDGSPNGLLLASSYWGGVGLRHYASLDKGATWLHRSTIPQPVTPGPLTEVSILDMGDDHLMMMVREDDETEDNFIIYDSPDLGYTWGPPRTIATEISGHPRLTRLPNGEIVTPFRNKKENVGTWHQWGWLSSKDNGTTWVPNYNMPGNVRQMYGNFLVLDNGDVILIGAYERSGSLSHILVTPVVPNLDNSPTQDTGWISVTAPNGYTGDAKVRVTAGIVYWSGTFIRDTLYDSAAWLNVLTLPRVAWPQNTVSAQVGVEATQLSRGMIAEIGTNGLLRIARSGENASELIRMRQIPPYHSATVTW